MKNRMDLAVFQQSGISLFAPENSAERSLWERCVSRIFILNGKLMGIHQYTGQLWDLSDEEQKALIKLPHEQFFYTDQDNEHPKELVNALSYKDSLVLALKSFTFEDGEKVELYMWNLDDSEMQLLNTPKCSAVWQGPNDTLIMRLSEDKKIILYDIQPQSETKTLWEENSEETLSGCVWNEDTKTLLFINEDGKIMMSENGGEAVSKGHLPVDFTMDNSKGWLLKDGRYMYLSFGSLYIRSIETAEKAEQKELKIAGYPDSRIVSKFSLERPDVSIAVKDDFNGFLSIQKAMVSGDYSNDIYMLNTNLSYGNVVKKGYAEPLNGSEILMKNAEKFYPAIKDAVCIEGKLYGYPANVIPQCWTINQTKWEEFNLGEYPKTIEDLIEVIKLWNDKKHEEEQQEYTLFESAGGFRKIAAFAVKQYLLGNNANGEMANFDTDDFKNVLTLLWDNKELFEEELDSDRMPIIMTYFQYYGTGYNDSDKVVSVIPPLFNANSNRLVGASMDVLVVNPLSKNKQEAIEFLEFYAENADTIKKYSLSPADNKPVRSSGFENLQAATLEKIEFLKNSLDNAADEFERRGIQELIDREQRDYNYREENSWDVTQEGIEIYKKIANSFEFPLNSVFTDDSLRGEDQAIYQVINEFADGVLPMDMFIKTLNEKARLIYLEGVQ
jgi:ABC-type glycerol-3-phosphate transport system substrate-binding protein